MQGCISDAPRGGERDGVLGGGNLVREIAKLAGGGGGGRPDFATAGARNVDQMDQALSAAKDLLAAQLS